MCVRRPSDARTVEQLLDNLGAAGLQQALTLARDLRLAGIGTDLDGRGGSMKSMLRRADSLVGRYASCAVAAMLAAARRADAARAIL